MIFLKFKNKCWNVIFKTECNTLSSDKSKVLHFTSITNSLGKKRGYNHYTYYIQYKLFCKFQGNHSNKMIKFMWAKYKEGAT